MDPNLSRTMVAIFSLSNGPPRRSLRSNVWSPVPAKRLQLKSQKFKADRQTHHENKVQFIKMFDITIHRLVININNF